MVGLSPADAERQIDALIFSRPTHGDHDAKMRRVAEALALVGDPQHSLRAVHVTGTNGKTSTSRMIESLLRAHGLSTGLFTSPHLTTFRERIQVDGQPLALEALVPLWERVAPAINAVDGRSLAAGGPQMSFFEVLTVLGLCAYADAQVDVAVIEVGIGGARDATNVVRGEVAVLTSMAEDHSNYFVGGITGVATEKSGIIKPGSVVVSATQPLVAEDIIRGVAALREASLRWEGLHHDVLAREASPAGQLVTLRSLNGTVENVLVPLHGDFQAQNAMIALAAVDAALELRGMALDAESVARGFAGATSPGRLEVISDQPTIIVDAAHNPHGVTALAGALGEGFGFASLIGVVAVLADKDSEGILAGLATVMDQVIVTQTASPRATPVDELAASACEAFGPDRVSVAPSVADALERASAMALERDGEAGVLVAGSITLVAQARRLVQRVHEAEVVQDASGRLADAGESSAESVPA